MTSPESKFKAARRLFPVTAGKKGITYFNSASTGPLCRPVKDVMYRYYEEAQYQNKNHDYPAFAALDNIRRMGAKIIGAADDEVGFGFHTGYGLNIAAFGLPLKKGDEVLLSDVEFPSNVYPWVALKERGIKVKFIKSKNGFFSIDNLIKSIGKKTRLLSLSFVQFFNGYKNDLKAIGEICKEHDMFFVVDGIQGCGVEPLRVGRCHVDVFAAGAQKWMLSPLGTGIFYVRKELQKIIKKPFASWLSVDWQLNFTDLFHYDLPFFDSARQYELGTYPYAHVFALEESLKLITSLSVKNIQRHNHGLLDELIDYLKNSGHYRIVSSLKKKHRSAILSFTCDDAKKVHKGLVRSGIICSLREGAIRVAVHLFNNKSDMRKLISGLKRYAK